jgi:serine O-acetyltransferase
LLCIIFSLYNSYQRALEGSLFFYTQEVTTMLRQITADFRAVCNNDPAARTKAEVALCYAGLHALVLHRVAHLLWGYTHTKLFARVLSHVARFLTGVEIHPGASIGSGLFIDHGMGVVIGETAVVGDNVTMFHGVTLGGIRNKKEKRHPTVEDGVTLGARATVLGPITIGARSVVGAGAVVLTDVPADCTVVGVPPAQRIIPHVIKP